MVFVSQCSTVYATMDAYKKLEEKIASLKRFLRKEEKRIAEYNLLLSMPQTRETTIQIETLLKKAIDRYRLLRIEIDN